MNIGTKSAVAAITVRLSLVAALVLACSSPVLADMMKHDMMKHHMMMHHHHCMHGKKMVHCKM